MSTMRRRFQNVLVRTLLHPTVLETQRSLYRFQRNWMWGGGIRVVEYFHQVDDPYSHLTSQVLHKFMERYDLQLKIHVVSPPSKDDTPDETRLEAYARLDASRIAPYYNGIEPFVYSKSQPSKEDVVIANRILVAHLEPTAFCKVAPRVGRALWKNAENKDNLCNLLEDLPQATHDTTMQLLQDGTSRREALGHYSSATFYFEGEWYWGLDRLPHLEQRLVQDGAVKQDYSHEPHFVVPFQDMKQGKQEASPSILDNNKDHNDKKITLQYFVSVRSPYSCISVERTLALARQYDSVDLIIRPVLPLVMRGGIISKSKRLYIVRDTHREAQRLGKEFGNLYDPLGQPIKDFFCLYPFAKERQAEFLQTFLQAAWCRGIDTAIPQGLRQVVEESNLDWDQARMELEKERDNNDWKSLAQENLNDMLEAGVWGVPSYIVSSPGDEPDFVTWGQDRIWLVQEEIQKRLAHKCQSRNEKARHAIQTTTCVD